MYLFFKVQIERATVFVFFVPIVFVLVFLLFFGARDGYQKDALVYMLYIFEWS